MSLLSITITSIKLLFFILMLLLTVKVLLILLPFFPELSLSKNIEALTAIGSFMAGIGTVLLSFFAFLAFGEWKKQIAYNLEHERIIKFRKASLLFHSHIHFISTYIKSGEHILIDDERDLSEFKDFKKSISILRKEYITLKKDFYISWTNFCAIKPAEIAVLNVNYLEDVFFETEDILTQIVMLDEVHQYIDLLDNDGSKSYLTKIFELDDCLVGTVLPHERYIEELDLNFSQIADLRSKIEEVTVMKIGPDNSK